MLLLFFSQAGYYLFFTIQQHQIKESVKQQLLTATEEDGIEYRKQTSVSGETIYTPVAPIEVDLNGTKFGDAAITTFLYIHFHPKYAIDANGLENLISVVPSNADFIRFAKSFYEMD